MELSTKKNTTQKQCGQTYKKELKEWTQSVINRAEKNGDTYKRNQFIALREEIV